MYQRPKYKSYNNKTLRKNICINLHDPGLENVFKIWHQKPKQQKRKIGKIDFIKMKNFCASKDTIKKVKRQPNKWEKIFANCISDKGLVSSIYKGLLQLSNKKTAQLINGQGIWVDIYPKRYTDDQ